MIIDILEVNCKKTFSVEGMAFVSLSGSWQNEAMKLSRGHRDLEWSFWSTKDQRSISYEIPWNSGQKLLYLRASVAKDSSKGKGKGHFPPTWKGRTLRAVGLWHYKGGRHWEYEEIVPLCYHFQDWIVCNDRSKDTFCDSKDRGNRQ